MSGSSAWSMDALLFLYWVPFHSEVFVFYLHLYNKIMFLKSYGFFIKLFLYAFGTYVLGVGS